MTFPVSCIIPARNAATTLERAVRSAYKAGCEQVMICDDASTDNTSEVIKRLYDEYGTQRMRWFINHGVRKGAGESRNWMISSEWTNNHLIICLDADDTLHDITPLVEAWQPGTWVYGNQRVIQEDLNNPTLYHGAPMGMLSRKEVTGVTFLFHKDDWLKVGGFDPDFAYAEDYAFQVALQANGVQGVYVDTLVYERYLKPEGNERTAKAGQYWNFYHQMAMQKWPSLFSTNR